MCWGLQGEILHKGQRAGQLALVLPTSSLKSYVGALRERRLLAPRARRAGLKRAGSVRQGAE
eukprot:1031659-Pleurochrysis_carterae.AAC.2